MERFKSQAVSDLIEAMDKSKEEFVALRRGHDWVAILHTIAQVFPGDRVAIYAKYEEENPPETKRRSGGARNATPPVKNQYIDLGECEDCPGGGGRQRNHSLGPPVKPHIVGAKTIPLIADSLGRDISHLLTEAGVLEAFENDGDMMAHYAREEGINLGNSSKPETIARKIAFYHKQEVNK